MPAPAPVRRTDSDLTRGGGFGGFAPNPYYRMPDGRNMVESYVRDADNATNFGGGGTTRTPSFNPTPAPTATPRTLIPDPSGAGLTPSRLTSETLRSLPNQRWTPDARGSAFADLGVEGGVEWEPTFPSGGGRSPPLISDPNDDWIGDPTARTTRSDGLPTESGMGDEPVLFADQEPNPQPTEDTEYTTSPGDRRFLPESSGGPIQRDYMANFGGDMTLGQLMNTPLALMNFGGNRYQPPMVQGGRIDYGGTSTYTPGDTPGTSDLNAPATPEEEANFAAAEEQGRRETVQRSGNESSATVSTSRFGNLNSPTGRSVYRDAQGNYRPTSTAPSDIRWSPDNPNNSNAAVSKFSLSPDVQDWGHGMASNDMSSAAVEGRFLIDEEGAPTMQGQMYGDPAEAFRMSQKSGSPKPYSDPASVAAFTAWQMQQPEYIAWMKKRKARSG